MNQIAKDAEPAFKKEKCTECGQKFSYCQNLNRHFLKAHPGKTFPQEEKAVVENAPEIST